MPSSLIDVCRFVPTLGGTTDWTFSAVVVGYQSPTAAGAVNAAVYSYRAESADLSQWEVGFGAYTSATGVFARTTVLFNSLGTTAKVSFSVAPQVAIVALAEDLARSISTASNVLSGDVALNNTGTFFDGPSMAQGTSGTWFASGTVTLQDTAGGATMLCKLWDGTTVIASAVGSVAAASGRIVVALSGYLASPAGNIRISVEDATSTSGKILFNNSGLSKDSSIFGIRIA